MTDHTLDSVFVSFPTDSSLDKYHNSCALEYVFPFATNPTAELDTFRLHKPDRTTTGLTARDLLLMRVAILGGEGPIESDDIILVGDYNQNNGLSTLDLALLTRVILREDINDLDEPWRFFVPQNTFPALVGIGQENLFAVKGSLLDEDGIIDNDLEIRSFKIGDVDGSYWSNNVIDIDNICTASDKPQYNTVFCDLDSVFIEAGQEFSIPIKFDSDLELYAMHFSFQSDKVQTLDVESDLIELEEGSNFSTVDSSFVLAYYSNEGEMGPIDYSRGTTLFTLTLRANDDFHLHDLFQEKAEFPREVYVNTDFEVLEIDFDNLDLSNSNELSVEDFVLYPNPVNDLIRIKWGGKEHLSNLSLEFLNIEGKSISHTVQNILDVNQSTKLSIPNLPNGLYLLRINSDQGSTIRKILVQQ